MLIFPYSLLLPSHDSFCNFWLVLPSLFGSIIVLPFRNWYSGSGSSSGTALSSNLSLPLPCPLHLNELFPHHYGQRDFYCWGALLFSSPGILPLLFFFFWFIAHHVLYFCGCMFLLLEMRARSAAAEDWISALPLCGRISLTALIRGTSALQAAPQRRSLCCKRGGLLSGQGETEASY